MLKGTHPQIFFNVLPRFKSSSINIIFNIFWNLPPVSPAHPWLLLCNNWIIYFCSNMIHKKFLFSSRSPVKYHRSQIFVKLWGYNYWTTSFNKSLNSDWKSCSWHVRGFLWWEPLTMFVAGNTRFNMCCYSTIPHSFIIFIFLLFFVCLFNCFHSVLVLIFILLCT